MSYLVEQLLRSQEGLCSVESVMVYENVSAYHIACDQQLNALCDDECFLLFPFQIGVI
jgi:hypothetical protein